MKVTIYKTGEFLGNVNKYRGDLIDYGFMKWAQYDKAAYVDFKPYRKRKPVRFIETFKPFLLIVEGDGPDPNGIWDNSTTVHGNGSSLTKASYSAFNEGWVNDFNNMIGPLIASGKVKVVADFRYTSQEKYTAKLRERFGSYKVVFEDMRCGGTVEDSSGKAWDWFPKVDGNIECIPAE